MLDELGNEIPVQNISGTEEQVEPAPSSPPSDELEQKLRATDGRLQKAESVKSTIVAQLRNAGYNVDDDGNIIAPQSGQYSTTQETTPPADEEVPDPSYDPVGFRAYIDRTTSEKATAIAQAAVNQALGSVMPTVDSMYERSLGSEYADWNDIKENVQQSLLDLGCPSLRVAGQYPKLLELAVDAARGRKALSGAPSSVDGLSQQEADRQARIAAANGLGGSTATTITHSSFTPEEQQYIAQGGLTEGLADELLSGPAIVGVTGQKGRTK